MVLYIQLLIRLESVFPFSQELVNIFNLALHQEAGLALSLYLLLYIAEELSILL